MRLTHTSPRRRPGPPETVDEWIPAAGVPSKNVGKPLVIFPGEVLHRRLDAALAVWDADEVKRHLDRGDRAEHHRLVQIAHVADAEDPAAEAVEPAAERHVEAV